MANNIKFKLGRAPFSVEDASDERRATRLLTKDKTKILQKFIIRAPVGFDENLTKDRSWTLQ